MNSLENLQERYRNLCRVCMVSRTDAPEMAALFKTSINTLCLSEMFTACTALLLAPADGLPNLICSVCLPNLVAAYEFQIQCIKADTEMRQALNCLLVAAAAVVAAEETPLNSTDVAVVNNAIKVEQDTYTIEPHDVDKIDPKLEQDLPVEDVEEFQPESHDDDESDDDSEYKEPVVKRQRLRTTGPKKKKQKKPIVCPVCNKIFDKSYRLRRHINVHNPDGKPYECDICKHRFACESNLIRHKIKHTDLLTTRPTTLAGKPIIFKCPECPREFAKQESLSSHLKTHKLAMSLREYVCEFCPKKFSKLNLMTRHMKIHDESKTHKCHICDRTFALGGQLIDHMNRHKGVKPHVCPYCNKGFQQSCTLKDHIRTHNGETPFLCSECGKSFNNGSNLRQHLLRHTGIKPFQCPECPSRFSCKGGLKSHMGTHTGAKPYICDICGSSFTKTYSLAKHKRIHTGERPYACEMCDMRFNSSDHVKRHMRTHTGEKPYKCGYCDRAFAQSNDLVKHTRSHVGDNTYQCKQCPAAFRLHSELRAHGKVHFLQQKQNEQQPNGMIMNDMPLISYVKEEAGELKDETTSPLLHYQQHQSPHQILKSDLSNDSTVSMQHCGGAVADGSTSTMPQDLVLGRDCLVDGIVITDSQ